MEIEIVETTLGDAYQMAPRMREVDALEVRASGGLTPLDALTKSVACTDAGYGWSAFIEGQVGVMWGVTGVPKIPNVGCVWMLGTDDIYQIVKRFWRESVLYVDIMHEKYPILCNYIDARNTPTRRWLKRLGFKEITSVQNFGHEKREFIYIESNRCV